MPAYEIRCRHHRRVSRQTPDDRRDAIGAVLKVKRRNMPGGYVEAMTGDIIW